MTSYLFIATSAVACRFYKFDTNCVFSCILRLWRSWKHQVRAERFTVVLHVQVSKQEVLKVPEMCCYT